MIRVFFLFILLFSLNAQAQTVGAICDGCSFSQVQSKARYVSNQLHQNDGTVYVLDFDQNIFYKFMTFMSDDYQEPQNIGSALSQINGLSSAIRQNGYHEDEIIGIRYFPLTSISSNSATTNATTQQLNLIQLSPTSLEIDDFHDFRDFHITMKNQPEVSLAGLGFTSAYDVIGNHAAGLQLGNYVENNYTWGYFMGSSLERVTGYFNIPGINSYTYQVQVVFSDGSTLHMKLQNGDLKPIPGEFYDSEGNRIPETSNDIDGQIYMYNDYYSNNVINFMNRMQSLGVSIVYEGSQQNRYQCQFKCKKLAIQADCSLSCKQE